MSTGDNGTTANLSTAEWDEPDSLWPDQTPFDVLWYGVLLIVLYSVVSTVSVVGKSVTTAKTGPDISMTVQSAAVLRLIARFSS